MLEEGCRSGREDVVADQQDAGQSASSSSSNKVQMKTERPHMTREAPSSSSCRPQVKTEEAANVRVQEVVEISSSKEEENRPKRSGPDDERVSAGEERYIFLM